MYSNSKFDISPDAQAAAKDETETRAMYERAPYPGLGAGLKDMGIYFDSIMPDLRARKNVRFLEAGCGTGHILVGVAKQNPTWDCYGIDLSQASLDLATQLAAKHGTKVTVKRQSYLDPLPFTEKFDLIAAIGTIMCCSDPVAAMRNIRSVLKDDGYLVIHLYGLRVDRKKFDIKEMLSIFEPDLDMVDRRFAFYDALMKHRERHWLKHLLQMPLIEILSGARVWLRNLLRRSRGIVWSPPFTDRYTEPTAPWIDHFCHPCERAYEVPEVVELVRESGFTVQEMLGQGHEYAQLIPPEWRVDYDRLPPEAKWRLSELLAFGGASFRLILRKDKTT